MFGIHPYALALGFLGIVLLLGEGTRGAGLIVVFAAGAGALVDTLLAARRR